MKYVWMLLVICAGFMAAPAQAKGGCLPTEFRDSFLTLSASASQELQAAKTKFESTKKLDDQQPAAEKKVKAALSAASAKMKEAEIKVKTQTEMAELIRKFVPCAPDPSGASAPAVGASAPVQPPALIAQAPIVDAAELADLRSTVKWNQKLLIFLIFLFIAAIILLYISLRTLAKRIYSSLHKLAMRIKEAAETQTDTIQNLLARISSRFTGEPPAAPAAPKSGGQGHKMQFGPQAAESMQPTVRKAAPEQSSTAPFAGGSSTRGLHQADDPHGQTHTSLSQGHLISNGNTQYGGAAKAKMPPASLFSEEDVDGQLSESEIWPIVLPIAGSLVETVANLDAASLTRELMSEIDRSRPSLARRMRNIGFQAISGRLAQDGRETSRNPEMFAVELPGRILLFPSPRGKYKQAFDSYFEGANMENWKECIQPALVQKTGDNLLSVIERGISGR